jgi:murein DD-endopeptidase MepM/ murein hydrolase activator NlpD
MIAGLASAGAQDFVSPRLKSLPVDWQAARADLPALSPGEKEAPLDLLNGALAERFPGIAASPVPVLLPFDTAAYMRDRAAAAAKAADAYLGGFAPSGFFLAGPTGYDAVFSVRAGSGAFTDISFAEPIFVEISGFAATYDLPPPAAASETPVRGLDGYPGIRRVILESYLRYSFERYGIRYVVAIQCYDAPPRARRLACRQADKVAVKLLQSLRLVGGNADAAPKSFAAMPVARPQAQSPDFTFYGPGRLIPNTGMKNHDGVADYTVYAPIRYPLLNAPSYANSQSFMNWGDCDQTGRAPSPHGRKDAQYRCRVNFKPLVFNEGARENYDYPWRDNFCEHRFFFVGQCGSGYGHQGQDIRPAACRLKNDGADRCIPYLDDVVAVMDGMVLRAPKQQAAMIVVNDDHERIRFRYMHMNPNQLDEDAILSGARVRQGEVIGKVGNYNHRENGTTYHLHFEAMVPTEDGWVRVNPYATLIVAYEHLIGGRGRELKEEPPAAQAAPAPAPAEPQKSADAARTKRSAHGRRARGAFEHSLNAARHQHRRKQASAD